MMPSLQQIAVGFEKGFRLAAIEPGIDLRRPEAQAVVDHAHEHGREIVLPLDRLPGGDGLLQITHETGTVLEVVETDLGQA